jgi:ElaB/YqjD/DUF883 family membrane-anchored ribosome-binding protein
MNEYVPCDLNA